MLSEAEMRKKFADGFDFPPLQIRLGERDALLQENAGLSIDKGKLDAIDERRFRLTVEGQPPSICTLDRDLAQADETIQLLGIDHPFMQEFLNR